MIRKAVIPVAGLGSRLLPLTRALPKEMLPIGDKPVIEHTIRELVESGIDEITIVTSGRKHLVQQHFAPDADLELQLREAGKPELADAVREVSSLAHITYLYQNGPYGNGTPVLNAARVIGDEPFMVLWADDVFVARVPRAKQLKAAYEATRAPVLALMPMAPEDAPRYGVPIVKEDRGQGRLLISGLVEKPSPEQAPSRYAAIGGYVVTPGVVAELEAQTRRWERNPVGEIYLTHALHEHALKHEVYGQVIDGTWWDTGSPLNYLRAQFAAALAHPVHGPELRRLARDSEPPA
ncbi:MAG: UTP--glucose-1-phosphate uridylyltransferase [Nonomuraea sp.]|nr:UTP--glucose-1-phosphate uridylyltransferase [Nonomuraea sp.]NUP67989.1 UTP--glucose-1-phosphate uridylyltransferase [Nonomuraea sp.]NUP79911.1 UTP--glucose-1-phosphate uridylyltransferase [Nonomuraea sp.]NUS09672.1 UTP--glucose-1-phosphate uridylyltransferase [Nonomuraea sp.]NUT41485.1 UTP--glucose-1-phosphate uridylyltransferase [Thermoactinospora sp.]